MQVKDRCFRFLAAWCLQIANFLQYFKATYVFNVLCIMMKLHVYGSKGLTGGSR